MATRFIYNTSGECVAFEVKGYLFSTDAEYLGFIRSTNEVFSKDGQFVGYLLDDDRIVSKKNEFQKMPVIPPIPPIRPLKPAIPRNRIYKPLPSNYEDVLDFATRGFFPAPSSLSKNFSRFENMDLIGHDGTFLGKLSKNSYDPQSISNAYTYGSKYSADSIFNPYGKYGGKYSNQSPFNPYASEPPTIQNHRRDEAVLTVNPYAFGVIERVNPRELLFWLGHLSHA